MPLPKRGQACKVVTVPAWNRDDYCRLPPLPRTVGWYVHSVSGKAEFGNLKNSAYFWNA